MIIIGSDHAGIELKKEIIKYLYENHIEYSDVTTTQDDNDDYPDVASTICYNVLKNKNNIGIAICGTGIGMSIACNKIRGIRAAMCTDTNMAEMSKRHNNSNVLCLGSRLESSKNPENVKNIVRTFIDSFYEGGRHDARLLKISQIENMDIEGDK